MEIKKIEGIEKVLGILWEYDQDLQRINFPKDSPNYEVFKERILGEYKEEPEGFFLVYEYDKVIGHLVLKTRYNPYRRQKYGEVKFIHLDANNRGKGYGTKLLEFADEYFKNKGCKYVMAGVSIFNPASNAAFKKVGYSESRLILEKEY